MGFIQLQVLIPQDAEVGDALTFIVEGKECEIPVPEGAVPGDVLQIQVESNDDNGNNHDKGEQQRDRGSASEGAGEEEEEEQQQQLKYDDDDETFDVPLHESLGITLQMKCSSNVAAPLQALASTQDKCNSDKKEETGEDNEKKDGQNNCSPGKNQPDGTSAVVWPTALHLSKCFRNLKWTTTKKSIVEIGSGLGVVGLSFMATASSLLSHRKSDVKKIKLVMTDLPSTIPLIEYNILSNSKHLSSCCSNSIRAQQLVWGEDFSLPSFDADLILASDILYNIQAYELLCQSISSIIYGPKSSSALDGVATVHDGNDANNKTRPNKCHIILAVRWRKPEEERKFFQLMESMLHYEFNLILEEIENEEYKCDLNWREYGNPGSEVSDCDY